MISPGVGCLCWPTQVRSFGFPKEGPDASREKAMRHVREVLRLKFVGGVPTREIARRIGVAASTVRATIKRFQAAGLSWPPPEELITASTRGYFPMPARSRATDVRSSPTGPASQTQSGHSSESEINHLVMAITSAEATFWHYRFRQNGSTAACCG